MASTCKSGQSCEWRRDSEHTRANMFSTPTNVIRTGKNSLGLRQPTERLIRGETDRPWNHSNLEASEGADTQTCDGTDQNFNQAGEGNTQPGMQLVGRPGHSVRIDQESEVCKPREGVQGR